MTNKYGVLIHFGEYSREDAAKAAASFILAQDEIHPKEESDGA